MFLTMSEINAFISAQYTNSSLKMQWSYTLCFCPDNFLHSESPFNSSLSSDVIFPDWHSVFKTFISFFISSVLLLTFGWTFSMSLFFEVWHQQTCTVRFTWDFCTGEHDVFCFISNAPLWLYIELWCLFFNEEKYWVCSQVLSWDWNFYLRVCHLLFFILFYFCHLLNIVQIWLLIFINFKVVHCHRKS